MSEWIMKKSNELLIHAYTKVRMSLFFAICSSMVNIYSWRFHLFIIYNKTVSIF